MRQGIKPEIKLGDSYSLIPEGMMTLQILDVNMDKSSYLGVEKDVLNYKFAVLDEIMDEDNKTVRGRFLWKRCSLSLNAKSWLCKLASAVVGHEMSDDEKVSFDPESLVGQQVQAMVEQKPSQDGSKVYNNILKFSKVSKKLETVAYDTTPVVVEKTSAPINVDVEVANVEKELK